jgi:putative ABC transport system ATP-binding protein
LLEIRDLEFGYGAGAFHLRLAELEIGPGETVAFVGPSGCGKTTLIHLIAGILAPTRGRISLLGQDLGGLTEAGRRRLRAQRIGLVFQEFELLDYLSVRDNVLLANLVNRALPPARSMRDAAERLAASLGLGDALGRRPAQLAQGERQRVAIGRALLNEPALLIADEPTGNLDPDSKASIMALIWQQVRARRCTFLMVTHDHGLLAPFDRVLDCRELVGAAA